MNKGQDGEDGNANVIYSDWMDIEWNGADETYNKAMIIEEPLVADISDKGTLLMYVTDEIGTVALMIPFLYDNDFFYFYAVNSSNVGLALTVESLDRTTLFLIMPLLASECAMCLFRAESRLQKCRILFGRITRL